VTLIHGSQLAFPFVHAILNDEEQLMHICLVLMC
jgi:hypothetical protein